MSIFTNVPHRYSVHTVEEKGEPSSIVNVTIFLLSFLTYRRGPSIWFTIKIYQILDTPSISQKQKSFISRISAWVPSTLDFDESRDYGSTPFFFVSIVFRVGDSSYTVVPFKMYDCDLFISLSNTLLLVYM